jgi:hypothetical protein
MSSEHDQALEAKELPTTRIVPILYSDDSNRTIIPHLMNLVAHDPISKAIEKRLELSLSQLEKLSAEKISIPTMNAHGRRRSKRERGDIQVSLDRDINCLEEEIKMLRGETKGVRPIEIKRQEGKVVVCKVGSFTLEEEQWWRFVEKRPDLVNYARTDPNDFSIVQNYYILRARIQGGEVESPKQALSNFGRMLDQLQMDTQREDQLSSFIREVTQNFSN